MKPILISMALIHWLLPLQHSLAQSDYDVLFQKTQDINRMQKSCASPTPIPTASPTVVKTDTAKLPGTEIEVSLVSLKKVKELFEEMKSHKDIPYRYPEDGCYARAYKMSALMEEQGVITGKAFVEGDLQVNTKENPSGYVQWWFHVAPVIMVKVGNKQIPYVIDPSTFKEPVPVETWTGLQTCNNQKECTNAVYYTNRFKNFPNERTLPEKTSYRPDEISRFEHTLFNYKKIEEKRILKESKKNEIH